MPLTPAELTSHRSAPGSARDLLTIAVEVGIVVTAGSL